MSFQVEPTPLAGVKVLQRHRFSDDRGSFARLFDTAELAALGSTFPIAQINHSATSRRGSLRGMHYQLRPKADAKLVTCIRGVILDVAVDLRKGSPTLCRWHGEILSAANQRSMLIPAGFAHGFQTLSDDVELIYCHGEAYDPAHEGALNAFDARLAIAWPERVTAISDRDRSHAMLPDAFEGFAF